MLQNLAISAIVVAGGLGTRFGAARPKQLAPLGGRPILSRTLALFDRLPFIDEIILALPADWLETIMAEAARGFRKVRAVAGGATRTESTRAGFAASRGDIVLVHDGVRPLTEPAVIEGVARAAMAGGAALAAAPVRDTLKLARDGRVARTVDRENMWRAQTPQGFRREVLAEALAAGGPPATDDAALAERLGRPVTIVPSPAGNLKITTPEDLRLAEALMGLGSETRVGQGFDVHRLVAGRPLWLGCVEVPYEKGLLGHSDADVLAHALADGILGAAGLGDIGQHFPENDERWAGAAGAAILAETMALARAAGWELVNGDVTLIGERPKIGPYRGAMAAAMAAALGAEPGCLNVKATTTERLGFTGDGQALAATAVALLRRGPITSAASAGR